MREITSSEIEFINNTINQDVFNVYTCAKMARKSMENNKPFEAVFRLSLDNDKIRAISPDLANLISDLMTSHYAQ